MNFHASKAARAHTEARGETLKAIANWTLVRGRYREPSAHEAAQPLVKISRNAKVCRDEGLLFIKTEHSIVAYTVKELGL